MTRLKCAAFSLGLLITATAVAQSASAPPGSTGECRDGTYSSAPSKRGACAGHKGVKDWYANDAAKPAESASAPATARSGVATPTAAPVRTAAPAPTTPSNPSMKSPAARAAATPAPGGGPGQVWVNTSSKVYHCPGSKYYGTTKAGEYMTEAAAKAAGAHGDHGKACT